MYCVYGNSGRYINGGPLFGGGPLLGGSVIGGSTVLVILYRILQPYTSSPRILKILRLLQVNKKFPEF